MQNSNPDYTSFGFDLPVCLEDCGSVVALSLIPESISVENKSFSFFPDLDQSSMVINKTSTTNYVLPSEAGGINDYFFNESFSDYNMMSGLDVFLNSLITSNYDYTTIVQPSLNAYNNQFYGIYPPQQEQHIRTDPLMDHKNQAPQKEESMFSHYQEYMSPISEVSNLDMTPSSSSTSTFSDMHYQTNTSTSATIDTLPSDFESSLTNRKQHQDNIICPTCNNKFGRPQDMKRHFDSVHSGKREYCMICKSSFGRKDALRRHQKAYYSRGDLRHKPTE